MRERLRTPKLMFKHTGVCVSAAGETSSRARPVSGSHSVLISVTEPRLTQFQAERPSLCHAIVVAMVTGRVFALVTHVWRSVHLENDRRKALLYSGFTAGCFNGHKRPRRKGSGSQRVRDAFGCCDVNHKPRAINRK